MIYQEIKKRGPQNVISVMTDSIAFEKSPGMRGSKKLGGWSLDFKGEGVFIGSGLYSLKNSEGVKTATRGFKLTSRLNFFTLLAENENKKQIEMQQQIRLSYREALRVKRFMDWNVFNKTVKKININSDNKRVWQRDFKNCKDVLLNVIDSAPHFVNMTK